MQVGNLRQAIVVFWLAQALSKAAFNRVLRWIKEIDMEHKQTTFANLKTGATFRFPGGRRFFIKIASGYKNIGGGALHSCAGDQAVDVA